MARIDEFLSDAHVESHHERTIDASAAQVFETIEGLDFRDSWIVRTLLRLRGLPDRAFRLRDLTQVGFLELARDEKRELVLGLVAQPWRFSGNLQTLAPEEFVAFEEPGFAKVAWNFELIPSAADRTRLSTRTRVFCTDAQSRRRFRAYWALIGPFSGLIRRMMLRLVAQRAER